MCIIILASSRVFSGSGEGHVGRSSRNTCSFHLSKFDHLIMVMVYFGTRFVFNVFRKEIISILSVLSSWYQSLSTGPSVVDTGRVDTSATQRPRLYNGSECIMQKDRFTEHYQNMAFSFTLSFLARIQQCRKQ